MSFGTEGVGLPSNLHVSAEAAFRRVLEDVEIEIRQLRAVKAFLQGRLRRQAENLQAAVSVAEAFQRGDSEILPPREGC
jgi:hypothetical protein